MNFQNYLAIEDLGGPNWHPDKNELTFVYNAPGIYQVFKTGVEKDKKLWPSRLTFDENRCTNARYLSDGTQVFVMDKGGDENFQIGLITPQGIQHWLTDDLGAKFNLNTASENYLYYSSNTVNKSRFDIYRHRIPLLENKAEKIFSPTAGIVATVTISADEKSVIIKNSFSNAHSDLLKLDVETGEVNNLTDKLEPHAVWDSVRFMGQSLLVSTNYEFDYKRLGLLTFEGQFSRVVESEAFAADFTAFEYKETSNDLYFVINRDGYSRLYVGRFEGSQFVHHEITLPSKGVLVAGDQRSYTKMLALNHDSSLLAIAFSTSTNPTNIYVMDLKDNTSWQLTESAVPGLDAGSFSDASLHSFKSFDDLEVPYFKYLPSGDKPGSGWPTLMVIHGGPEAQYKPAFQAVMQFYISSGFAVIAPNIRGSNGYGMKYMNLDNKEKRLDSILDIKELAIHLTASDTDIDGNKLIIYGGSYGGFAVLSAMTEHPDLWVAGVDIVGISDFVTFLTNTAPWRRALREGEYGSLEHDREMLKSISPIHKLDNISAPLFIIQGDNDERVPLSESIQMHERLVEKGLNSELLRFADEGHGLAKLKNKIIAYPRVVEWLKEIIH